MSDMMYKLLVGEPVTDKDKEDELYDICEREHSSCSPECHVYALEGRIPYTEDLTECKCFKDGSKMLAYIREKITSNG